MERIHVLIRGFRKNCRHFVRRRNPLFPQWFPPPQLPKLTERHFRLSTWHRLKYITIAIRWSFCMSIWTSFGYLLSWALKHHILTQEKTKRQCSVSSNSPKCSVVRWSLGLSLFGSRTPVTRVSLTDMRNINNPALQAERLVLLSDKSNLVYQGYTGLRSCAVRCQAFCAYSDLQWK